MRYFKKYFLTVLALMLVLSNFSFATTYMLCGMSDDNAPCCCKHNSHQPASGLSLTKSGPDCCREGVAELANSNLLSTVKIELPSDISSFSPVLVNLESESLHSNNISFSYITQIEHVPKSDIPIFTSSLLI